MLVQTIKYTDYNGNERKEDYYFNLTQAELMEWSSEENGGMGEHIQQIVDSKNIESIIKIFKEIILKAYGEKDPSGKYFKKFDENGHRLSNNFAQTEAYSALFTKLASDSDAASEFINGIIPKDVLSKIDKK